MPPRATTLILSDTHLGRPGRRAVTADRLRPLWADGSVDRVVLNGDVAELQIPALRGAAARQLQRLTDHCQADGVELTLLSGNHDAYSVDRRHAFLADGRVLVTHGDALHPAITPWCSIGGETRRQITALLAALPIDRRLDLESVLYVYQHAAHSQFVHPTEAVYRIGPRRLLRSPWEVALILWYWLHVPQLGRAFLRDYAPHAEVLVIGHTHWPGVWRRGGRTVINTGTFAHPHRPRAVLVDETAGTLAYHKVERAAAGYRLGRALRTVACRPAADAVADRRDDPLVVAA